MYSIIVMAQNMVVCRQTWCSHVLHVDNGQHEDTESDRAWLERLKPQRPLTSNILTLLRPHLFQEDYSSNNGTPYEYMGATFIQTNTIKYLSVFIEVVLKVVRNIFCADKKEYHRNIVYYICLQV